MSDLVQQLREFPQFVSMDPGRWFQSGRKEPLCQQAADELERLTRENLELQAKLEEARKDAERGRFTRDNRIQYFEPTRHWKLTDAKGRTIREGIAESYESAIDAAMSQEKRKDALDRMARDADELGLDF